MIHRRHVDQEAAGQRDVAGDARALLANGINIETSIFKYGRRSGLVAFDYSHAHHALIPWRAADNDLCCQDIAGRLWEYPIYCERRWIGAFLTPQRVYRSLVSRAHKISSELNSLESKDRRGRQAEGKRSRMAWLAGKHAWKADFNQCSGGQLIRALDRAIGLYGCRETDLPFVLIGHSKLFTRQNQSSLRTFLAHVARGAGGSGFGTFGDFCESPRKSVNSQPGLSAEFCRL